MNNGLQTLKLRYGIDKMSNWGHLQDKAYQTSQQDRINVRGKDLNVYANSFIRLRESTFLPYKFSRKKVILRKEP